jgi:hypothetical protein
MMRDASVWVGENLKTREKFGDRRRWENNIKTYLGKILYIVTDWNLLAPNRVWGNIFCKKFH